ncbi:MAG: hypothetical protein HGA67_02550 [Candidatus Yonathbacteria bacterium]|nr:hypothetical protein [Candidatus Yonathbacteria bacterium]
MIDILKYKNILIGLVVVVAAFAVYQVFVVNKTDVTEGTVLITDESNVSPDERSTLQLLSDMQSISLTANVLQSTTFLSLKDFSVPIQPEPQGRENPFAPVAGVVSTGGRTTSQTVSTPSVGARR